MYMINLPKNDIKWLDKALDKKDVRTYCNQILVHKGFAYATNGYVIHKAKCAEDEQEGLYTREGTKLDDSQFNGHPLTRRDMFTNFNHEMALILNPNRLDVLDTSEIGFGVSLQYFTNAIDKCKKVNLLVHDSGDKLLLQYENREAIIMFMKI